MRKKLLSLVMTGAIALTLIPAVNSSAAKINNTKTTKLSVSPRDSWHNGHIYADTELYYQPYSDTYAGSVAQKTEVSYQYYGNGWYYVFVQGKYFYVYGSGHFC
ncbi:hypothetical protein BJV85_003775 [Clostridium acetobutylicum]|uniref:Uncharacterized protein n=1 Tax=Clostridium acetobutylicum (strain ATCC 824 / DSM 792 / JCM 1419 / IAM 19013 / LMG 5710 / NBRC 13948 / NRRL B-527 / VKM B-1787 / 2291 / W) TaxID=272562 RepID=Q97TI9_CLOAB|nr:MULTISPECIES: hypothetical protein [Clostridium]AAK76857.1 Hypothetical protein CA_P0112 [Clostridium acetobutylicum ATCC 824]ADZ22894.1 Conserved hypothetical protein [Clostridium acetobutylicum EA 2018]AEI34853.1 hypothetical protein SMB_P110 [Clostridium acetobutylicum DSM 1731]AWV82399.1 hypothetical protein DK921_20120 [Clostridium acetobutylicum]MBC2395757.1 hypothetical protein [Clostridium acetobutylicum]